MIQGDAATQIPHPIGLWQARQVRFGRLVTVYSFAAIDQAIADAKSSKVIALVRTMTRVAGCAAPCSKPQGIDAGRLTARLIRPGGESYDNGSSHTHPEAHRRVTAPATTPILSPLQRSVLRKTAWRLVPLLTVAYIFNYLDRTCLGIAALTMNRDIGLSASQFGLGAGIFFLGYSVFEVPSNLAMVRFGARRWIARILITWGIASAATALVTGPHSFYAVRFILGIAEAGFFPGITFLIAAWFPTQYRTQMLAWFLVGIPASSLIGGPICGALLELNGVFGLAGWKWLFLAVSLPCVVMGLLVLWLLADRPEEASWLTGAERSALIGMLNSEVRDRPRASLWAAIRDPRVLILAGVQFGFTLGSYGIGIWLPLIIKEHRLSNLAVGFVSAVPYLFACIAMLAWAAYVDRAGRKIVNLTITCLLAAIGLAGSVITGSFVLGLVGLTVGLIGVTAARAIFWTIPTRFLTGVAAAGGLAFINTIGTLGGFAGPAMMGWLHDFTGSFTAGLLAMAAIMLAATLLAASLKLVVRHE